VLRRKVARPDIDFGPLRAELEVPDHFPPEVTEAAVAAAGRPRLPDHDATDLPLMTVDPPGSRDLDQALHIAPRPGGGYRVSYAIADVAAFVTAGDPVDIEARRRGETLYAPGGRAPLHPPEVSEGAASLLADQDRPALLWTIDLDADGAQTSVELRRAMVRSRAQLDYPGLQQAFDAGTAPESLRLLAEVGPLRQTLALARGAIDLGLPDQEIVPSDHGGWTVAFRAQLPVERWNAQVSLLTGSAAARLMLDAGIGLLRTLPPADRGAVDKLRRAAAGLGVAWPEGAGPGEVVASVDPALPHAAAFLELAAELLRGAGYTPFDGALPDQPDHAGVGGPYAHVTAPIRRLADRFASEVCLAACAGTEVPDWAREALPLLPDLLAASTRRAKALDRATIDLVEAWILQDRVGEVFDAAVVEVSGGHAMVVLDDPSVRARCDGVDLPLGKRLAVRLTEADPVARTVRFVPAR
jgi:exoribonuclease R